jgi:hypothetical protein
MILADIDTAARALAILGERPTTIGYALAKNLRIAKRILDDAQEIFQERVKSILGDREPQQVVIAKSTGKTLRPHDGVSIIGDDEALMWNLTTDEKAELDTYWRSMQAEDHDVTWHRIPAAKVDGLDLPGNALVPLMGFIIVDGEDGRE